MRRRPSSSNANGTIGRAGVPFLTVCGYPIDTFDQARPDVFAGVCAEHQAVCHAGYLA